MLRKYGWSLVAAVLVAALWLPCASRARENSEFVFSEQTTVILEPGALISAQTVSGNIDVTSWDKDQVLVKATKRVRASSREEAATWAQKITVIIEKSDGGLTVRAERPREWSESLGDLLKGFFDKKPSASVDFAISTPRDVEIEASSVSGNIAIAHIAGDVSVDVVSGDVEISEAGSDVSINTVSGDLILKEISGNLEIDAVSGDVVITNVGGDVSAAITSGDIIVERVLGGCSVDGTSGDVRIDEVHGDINIDVTSGDILVRQRAGSLWIDTSSGDVAVETAVDKSGRYYVETSSGQIAFRIPPTSSSTIELESSGGKIQAKLPMTVESVSRTRLLGIMGTGEGEIVLSSSSGDIQLLPQE